MEIVLVHAKGEQYLFGGPFFCFFNPCMFSRKSNFENSVHSILKKWMKIPDNMFYTEDCQSSCVSSFGAQFLLPLPPITRPQRPKSRSDHYLFFINAVFSPLSFSSPAMAEGDAELSPFPSIVQLTFSVRFPSPGRKQYYSRKFYTEH